MAIVSETIRNLVKRIPNIKYQISNKYQYLKKQLDIGYWKLDIGYSCVKQKLGFTLIELIVVITIIAILFAAIAALFNPFSQIEKAKNATRQADLHHIVSALDTYVNDTGCYPVSIPFGSKWASGNTVFMEKVPEDPDCSSTNPSACYVYETDSTATCPGWNVLFAQLQAPIASSIPSCLLTQAQACLPTDGIAPYNYCIVSGKMDCPYISSNPLPSPTVPPGNGGSGGGGNGGNGGSPTPTPTLVPINCNNLNLSACSNGICNVESASQCMQCGGSLPCYNDLQCGGVKC